MDKITQPESKRASLEKNIIKDSLNDIIIESKYYIKSHDKPKQEITNKIKNYIPYGKE